MLNDDADCVDTDDDHESYMMMNQCFNIVADAIDNK